MDKFDSPHIVNECFVKLNTAKSSKLVIPFTEASRPLVIAVGEESNELWILLSAKIY